MEEGTSSQNPDHHPPLKTVNDKQYFFGVEVEVIQKDGALIVQQKPLPSFANRRPPIPFTQKPPRFNRKRHPTPENGWRNVLPKY